MLVPGRAELRRWDEEEPGIPRSELHTRSPAWQGDMKLRRWGDPEEEPGILGD